MKPCRLLALGAVLLAAVTATAWGAAFRDFVLYEGDLKGAPNLWVGSWGGGYAKELSDYAYYGPGSMQISTQGYYQGVIFRFAQPVDISAFTSRPDGCLEMRIRPYYGKAPATSSAAAPGAVAPGGGTRPTGTTVPRFSISLGGRDRQPGGESESPAAPAPTTAAAPPEKLVPTFLMQQMRVVLETEQGMVECSSWPLYYSSADREGWRRLSLPLAMFKGGPLGAQLRSVRIFAEPKDVFYLGQLKLTAVDQPISIRASAEPTTAAAGATISFKVQLAGAPLPVRVAWDFDNRDGIAEEAVGMTVSKIYHAADTYTVTCTATDVLGRRAPATTMLLVVVQ